MSKSEHRQEQSMPNSVLSPFFAAALVAGLALSLPASAMADPAGGTAAAGSGANSGASSGTSSGASAPAAEANAQKPKCQVAEVNPVTGHAVCVKPVGAPVEQPSSDLLQTCDSSHASDPDFSFGPNCKPQPKSGS
jgi:hypothetical protein